MERAVERRHPHLLLRPADLARLLEPALPDARILEAELLQGGKINTNYKLRLAGAAEPLLLRVYLRDGDACAREARLFELVQERVPVPGVIYADTTRDRIDYPYALLTWIEGEPLAQVMADWRPAVQSALGRQVGGVLARIGSFTFPGPGFLDTRLGITPFMFGQANPFLGFAAACLLQGPAGRRLGAELANRCWEFAQREAGRLADSNGQAALVHGDFNPSNIMVARNQDGWRVTGVLDWEWAHAGSPLMDFGNVLRESRPVTARFEQGLVRGFQAAGGTLPPDWKAQSKLIDLLSALEFLNMPLERPEIQAAAARQVVNTLDNWAGYVAAAAPRRRSSSTRARTSAASSAPGTNSR